MNLIILLIAMLVALLLGVSIIFLLFTRKGKNIVTEWLNNKKYVVCHIRKSATDFEEIWKVVPKPDYLTRVGKYDYNLNPSYSTLKWKGRLHFILNENDAIPIYPSRKNSNEEILFQVQELKTALHNTAYDFLYKKNANLAIIIAFIALAITLLVVIYAVYEIEQVRPIINWLQDHPPESTARIIITPTIPGK